MNGSQRTEPYRFLVMGQSNAVSPANNHPEKGSATTTVDGSHGPLDYGVSWFYLGDMIRKERGVPVEFDLIARGATKASTLIDFFMPDWEKALSSGKYDFVIWIQGESDQAENWPEEITREAYFKIFTMISRFMPADRVFLVKNSAVTPLENSPHVPVVRVQQEILNAGLATLAFNLDEVRANHPSFFGEPTVVGAVNAEFDNHGHEEHARLWLNVLRSRL